MYRIGSDNGIYSSKSIKKIPRFSVEKRDFLKVLKYIVGKQNVLPK